MSNFYNQITSMDWNLIAYFLISGILFMGVAGLFDLRNKDAVLSYIAMIVVFMVPATMVISYYHILGNIYLTIDIRFMVAVVIFILSLFSDRLKGLWGFVLSLVPILATWLFSHINFILS